MPLPKNQNDTYTSEQYWNLPDGQRAELIDGRLYAMAPPSRIHQEIITGLVSAIHSHIKKNNGPCKVYPAPFAVNLDAEDKNWVEPDISIICDPDKLTDRGCEGAPDWIIEIISPGSRRMDYLTKHILYANAGVREYWIVDPMKKHTTIYQFEKDDAPAIIDFDRTIEVGLWDGLCINIAELLK